MGELDIPPEELVLYRVVQTNGTAKIMQFRKSASVQAALDSILKKLEISDEKEYEVCVCSRTCSLAVVLSVLCQVSCDEYGVLDDTQSLQTYSLRNKSSLYLNEKGTSKNTKEAALLKIVCDDQTARELVFQPSHQVHAMRCVAVSER